MKSFTYKSNELNFFAVFELSTFEAPHKYCCRREIAEEGDKMIRFLCDTCGKDISAKVHDSIKQFCGRSYFEQSLKPRVTEDSSGQPPDSQDSAENGHGRVYLDIQLLDELSKLIHASAWGVGTTAMRCSNCALEREEEQSGRVVTIFTRISPEQCAV
ncbi:MAG: hypothetical protein JRI47_06580 [Deltaproteobacteria bacterium]|nr:hypothetical protein [Deltaproteobacteria bacterium]